MGLVGDGTIITLRVISDTAQTQFSTISGYILDGASAGISGVTVTLSGDDYKEDTTDANGFYSFSTMADGSYAITPTKTGYFFTADHEDVTVAGANVTVDTMVGEAYLTLPFDYNISDVSASSGLMTQFSDWEVWDFLPSSGSVQATAVDTNGWKPAWSTKALNLIYNGATRNGNVCIMPGQIDPSLTVIRFAWMVREASGGNGGSTCALETAEIVDGGTPVSALIMGHYGSYNPDAAYLSGYYADSTIRVEVNFVTQGVNITQGRYHWFRAEWNFDTDVITYSCVRAEDSASQYSNTAAINAVGQTYGHVMPNLYYFGLLSVEDPSDLEFLRFWVGSGTDAWPT